MFDLNRSGRTSHRLKISDAYRVGLSNHQHHRLKRYEVGDGMYRGGSLDDGNRYIVDFNSNHRKFESKLIINRIDMCLTSYQPTIDPFKYDEIKFIPNPFGIVQMNSKELDPSRFAMLRSDFPAYEEHVVGRTDIDYEYDTGCYVFTDCFLYGFHSEKVRVRETNLSLYKYIRRDTPGNKILDYFREPFLIGTYLETATLSVNHYGIYVDALLMKRYDFQ